MEVNYPWPQQAPDARTPLNNRLLERGRDGKNEWWRYLLGILLSFFVGYQIIGVIPLAILAVRSVFLKRITLGDISANPNGILDHEFLKVGINIHLAALLFIFVGAMACLWFALHFIHKKTLMSVISGVSTRFDFKRYCTAFAIWIGICSVQLTIALLTSPESFQFVFQAGPFFIGLIICLLLLPIQTGWEEIFLRGYLLQGLGLWMKKSLWPWIITSVAFGLLHIMNTEVQTNGILLMMPQYILPGLVFGAMAIMDERLEVPLGMHFAHNLFGILTVSSPDMSLSAHSIWSTESSARTIDAVLGIGFMLIALLIFYRLYKWDYKKLYQ